MPPPAIALIAPDPSDHIAWRLALRRVAADVRSVQLTEAAALPILSLWVVVLRGHAELLHAPEWASCLTARTLLVVDATAPALRLARLIRHPVLIAPRVLAYALDTQLVMLRELTAGIVHVGHADLPPLPDALPLVA